MHQRCGVGSGQRDLTPATHTSTTENPSCRVAQANLRQAGQSHDPIGRLGIAGCVLLPPTDRRARQPNADPSPVADDAAT